MTDLRARLRDPGFSPSTKHVSELVLLAADDTCAEDVERVLARLGEALARALAPAIASVEARHRTPLFRALGRTAVANDDCVALLESGLSLDDERARRAAQTALGKVGIGADAEMRARIEGLLLERLSAAASDAERRTIVEALGKVGGARALAALEGFATENADLHRVLTRARLMLARTERRQDESAIRSDVAVPPELPFVFFCRRGLERIVIAELSATFRTELAGPGRVRAFHEGVPLGTAFRSRVAERFTLELPAVPLASEDELADAVVNTLVRHEPVLTALTEGAIRFRAAFRGGGHRRALVWKIAERASQTSPRLVNDPSSTTWTVIIDEHERRGSRALRMMLSPSALEDPRFGYRSKDVPAASHPTIAAALAHVAGVSPDDVVWDPFVGSGLELIERARLGPVKALFGSDLEQSALDAARSNLARAGVTAELSRRDALAHFPADTNVVITNPPMGRRVHRKGDIGEMLGRFVDHVASRLPAGGRLVWLSPSPDRTNLRARAANLAIEKIAAVDVGGFDAELQRITKSLR